MREKSISHFTTWLIFGLAEGEKNTQNIIKCLSNSYSSKHAAQNNKQHHI